MSNFSYCASRTPRATFSKSQNRAMLMLSEGDAISCVSSVQCCGSSHGTHCPLRRAWPQVGLAKPSFSTSAFSRVKVSCANFLYADVLMYMGTMS